MTLIVLRPSLLQVLGSGGAAGVVVTALFALARLAELTTMNLEMTLGSWVLLQRSTAAWGVGLVLHLLISALLALIYDQVFRVWGDANARLGMVLGSFHALISGIGFSLLRMLHPLAAERAIPPGGYEDLVGQLSLLVFLVAHIAFGAVLGFLYHGRERAVPEQDLTRRRGLLRTELESTRSPPRRSSAA